MAFCRNCGNEIDDQAVVCVKCGAAVEGKTVPVQPQTIGGDADVQQNKGIAWLSYVGILLIIPLFVKKTSEYCKFHVKQGAILFCTELAYTIATRIILAIIRGIYIATPSYALYSVMAVIYSVLNTVVGLGSLLLAVLAIIGIVNAAKGEKKELPIIGKITILNDLMDKIYASINK
ncbi:MAG: zinc-ribbon domain-containing protein [Ruminococcus sp.]|nr:zinc-ribbon domain-containing protein [Ruminococcus sp.]